MKESVTGKQEGGKKSEFFFKSKVNNKEVTTQDICLFSFKALWKSQDLGTERGRGLLSLYFLKLPLRVVIGSTDTAVKEWGAERKNTPRIAQMPLQWKIISTQYKGFWKKNHGSIQDAQSNKGTGKTRAPAPHGELVPRRLAWGSGLPLAKGSTLGSDS